MDAITAADVVMNKDRIWLSDGAATPTYTGIPHELLEFEPVEETEEIRSSANVDSDGVLHEADIKTKVGENINYRSKLTDDGAATPDFIDALDTLIGKRDSAAGNDEVVLLVKRTLEDAYTATYAVRNVRTGGEPGKSLQLQCTFKRQGQKTAYTGELPTY
ncbi:MAG: hypothetical protein ACYC6A_21525 [Armatimonadota bacterium]